MSIKREQREEQEEYLPGALWNPQQGQQRAEISGLHTSSIELPFSGIETGSCTPRPFADLEYKTQVFLNTEGDYYRTRLTHTLEVSQIGRTVARALGANEDLEEAICLAHDLGHSPFGHSGERILNQLMEGYGGFDHNKQSLRIVTKLEKRFLDFPGLEPDLGNPGRHCQTRDRI